MSTRTYLVAFEDVQIIYTSVLVTRIKVGIPPTYSLIRSYARVLAAVDTYKFTVYFKVAYSSKIQKIRKCVALCLPSKITI